MELDVDKLLYKQSDSFTINILLQLKCFPSRCLRQINILFTLPSVIIIKDATTETFYFEKQKANILVARLCSSICCDSRIAAFDKAFGSRIL